MATVIKPARSYTPEWEPNTEILEEGEIGVNGVTGKVWMRDDQYLVKPVGGLYNGKDLPREDPAILGAFWNNDGILAVSEG